MFKKLLKKFKKKPKYDNVYWVESVIEFIEEAIREKGKAIR